ncbi:type IV toxin-antitoxin system AbiEi family antitoxin domain-containing protein [Mangrovibacterium sp.]|uniref:type IV toxin-antitoxin system AbiEi family antitoxin domain-containing protein n=1 Tax=Mangrovibacterium sp. TaxID=1961364 RepID=UPI003564CC6B
MQFGGSKIFNSIYGRKADHYWFQLLEIEQFDLGKGNRMLSGKGVFNPKYLL